MSGAPKCMHEGCEREDIVACHLPDLDCGEDGFDYLYCPDHCQEEGFCWGCGGFFAGIANFDLSADGLCDECRFDFQEPDYEEEEFFCEGRDPYEGEL